MLADGLFQQAKSPSMVFRRLIFQYPCPWRVVHMPQPRGAQKKVHVGGRYWGLCWQLTDMCCATCWLSAGQTTLTGGAWAVPLRSGLYDTAGGELMRPKAKKRSVLRRAVSSARTWKVSSVWYVPGDQQEGPLPSHCCCGRHCWRKGDPSMEKPPDKEQGLWARWKAKAKSLLVRKQTSERLEERCRNSGSSLRRRNL